MRNSTHVFVLLCMALGAGSAAADPTVDALTRIEAETAVLKAQVKKLEAQAQVAAKQAEINRIVAAPGTSDPRVRSIEGIGGTLHALIQLDNSSLLETKVGDVLPDGSQVVSIRPNEVIVEKRDRKRVRLLTGTSSTPARELGGTGSPSMSSLPSFPPPSIVSGR